MKKLLVAVAAVLVSAATYAQGQLNFITVFGNPRTVDAPVSRPGASAPGQGTGAGAGITAQLFLLEGGVYTALTPPTTFRTTSAAASFYVNDPGSPVTVPGHAPNTTAPIVLRAWDSSFATYDLAEAQGGMRGQSPGAANILLGGGTLPPTNPIGLQGFVMVPEPSTIALGVIGGLALLLRRRK
jgi:hypothetical protein